MRRALTGAARGALAMDFAFCYESCMHCAFCRNPLGYVHGHAACLRGGCPMFGVNQAECCAGDQGDCVPTSTAAAAGPAGVAIGTRGAGPDETAR